MKVAMFPDPIAAGTQQPSGITTLILKYEEHAKEVDIEFVVDLDVADVTAVHIAKNDLHIPRDMPLVAHCHGLYWTNDYAASDWEFKANNDVISTLREADVVTVPSEWVAESLMRDMRISPFIVPHGIDVDDWTPAGSEFILWNKNRSGDVCDDSWVQLLAEHRPDLHFLSTFYPNLQPPSNVKTTGLVKHDTMREYVQSCSIYLSTTKETYGIGILEAMASGKPVLGFDEGGITGLVEHGVNGYLAKPGDRDGLIAGLYYCLEHQKTLGDNSREMASRHTWNKAMRELRATYDITERQVASKRNGEVSVVVPCFNKADTIEETLNSILNQTHKPREIIVVDNNSTDGSMKIAKALEDEDTPVPIRVVNCDEQGVAYARNYGVETASGEFICCLDADDMIDPTFIEVCLPPLLQDRSLGLTYAGLKVLYADGTSADSPWPPDYKYDQFVEGVNQVPTCCIYQKRLWHRLAGYRQRYAPDGAGAEDVEFWYRMGAIGYGGLKVTDDHLFWYRDGGIVGGNKNYEEPDWRRWHSWTHGTGYIPFASMATPVNGASHPVRQYDSPFVSVIIPVGPDHTEHVWEAIESVVGQTFHKWEIVLVNDSGKDLPPPLFRAYPFLREIETEGLVGAGAARNKGVDNSRGDMLLFLDADDWLEPHALERMWHGWVETGHAVYSDYYGFAVLDAAESNTLNRNNRLLYYDEGTGRAIIKYYSMDYDCQNAQRQPDISGQVYIWCLVSSLVSKEWHNKVGGFDESMKSWEDWDYWIRLSKAGMCFHRVEEFLVNYRFFSGFRRMDGINDHQELMGYLLDKYEGVETVACGGCRGGRGVQQATIHNDRAAALRDVWGVGRTERAVSAASNGGEMEASSMVMIEIVDSNSGDHPVIGSATRIHYGYHVNGDQFLMDIKDARGRPDKYRILESASPSDPIPDNLPSVPGTSSAPVTEATHVLSAPAAPVSLVSNAGPVGSPVIRLPAQTDELMDDDPLVRQLLIKEVISPDQYDGLMIAGFDDDTLLRAAKEEDLVEVKGIGKVTAKKVMFWIGSAN